MLALAGPGIATSQTAPVQGQVLNSQIQLSDVFAGQTLQVTTADQGVVAQSSATSNSISATQVDAALDLQSSQRSGGLITAQTILSADDGTGPLLDVRASAIGNTATAGASGDVTSGGSTQTVDAGGTVSADSAVTTTAGVTTSVNVSASALGNSQGWSASNGALSATTTQLASSDVHAGAQAVVCCSTTSTDVQSSAVANNVTGDNTNATSYLQVTQTRDQGATDATALAQQTDGADIHVAATATSNNVNVVGTGGWNTTDVTQSTSTATTATATGTLGSWSGAADVTAYAMANSTYVANDNSAVLLTGTQTNSGGVSSQANLTANGAGAGSVSAIAVGNASTAYACGACGSGVGATVTQTNSGSIHATATANGQIGHVTSSASAVGNSLTIQSR